MARVRHRLEVSNVERFEIERAVKLAGLELPMTLTTT